MSRPTLDDLKLARDGTLAPLTLPQKKKLETAGDVAYLRDLTARAQRLRDDYWDLITEAEDLESEAMSARDELEEVLEEIEELGGDTAGLDP